MVNSERMTAFLRSLELPMDGGLEEIARQARLDGVPIIRQEMQSFLQVFLELKKPRRILEVGTAVGFSALFMASNTSSDCAITTIENDEERAAGAERNFSQSDYGARIRLLKGDAMKILPVLQESYDFIFMDAAKGQYIHFLPEILRLLSKGGILISDNVLQEGDILESHYAVERRNRTIYKRMRDYLYTLKHLEGCVTTVVPIADGAAVTVKSGS